MLREAAAAKSASAQALCTEQKARPTSCRADEAVEEELGHGRGIAAIGIAAFFREGEARQPVEQVLAGRGQHAVLREVDVRVDEARHDDAVAIVVDRRLAEALRQQRLPARPTGCVPSSPTTMAPFASWRASSGEAPKLSVWPRMTRVMPPPGLRCGSGRCGRSARCAVANSASGECSTRSAKPSRIMLLGRALDREDEGKAEPVLVGAN